MHPLELSGSSVSSGGASLPVALPLSSLLPSCSVLWAGSCPPSAKKQRIGSAEVPQALPMPQMQLPFRFPPSSSDSFGSPSSSSSSCAMMGMPFSPVLFARGSLACL